MKQLLSLIGFVCLIAMLLPACAPAPEPEPESAPEPVFDQAGEEAAIRQFVKQWYANLNAHDVSAAFTKMDENFENFSGSRKGRAANEKYWTDVFETRYKNVEYKQYEEIGIHFITPEVALYKDRYEYAGALDAEGKPIPPGKWSNGWVLVKRDGEWLVAEIVQWAIQE